jgi:hypothetical protein
VARWSVSREVVFGSKGFGDQIDAHLITFASRPSRLNHVLQVLLIQILVNSICAAQSPVMQNKVKWLVFTSSYQSGPSPTAINLGPPELVLCSPSAFDS